MWALDFWGIGTERAVRLLPTSTETPFLYRALGRTGCISCGGGLGPREARAHLSALPSHCGSWHYHPAHLRALRFLQAILTPTPSSFSFFFLGILSTTFGVFFLPNYYFPQISASHSSKIYLALVKMRAILVVFWNAKYLLGPEKWLMSTKDKCA